MIVNKNSTTNSQFLSALYPYVNNPPTISTLSSSNFTAIKILDGNFKDFAFTKSDTTTQTLPTTITNLNNDITTNATFTLFSVDGHNLVSQFFVDSCSILNFGSTNLLTASHKMDVAFQRIDSANYQGYAGKSGTISIYLDRAPVRFVGAGVSSHSYNSTDKKLTIVLISPSNFALNTYGPVNVEKGVQQIKNFTLHQNYPNPFNSSTVISYELSSNSYVTLKVYDVLGREIAVLVNDYKQAGNYKVEFGAENLLTGVYFYKLQVGSLTEVKKMVLIK